MKKSACLSSFATQIVIVFILIYFSPLLASELLEITPVTNKILLLHFNDGYVDNHELGQTSNGDVTYNNPLDVGRAANRSTFIITSQNDDYYKTGRNPVNVGRKSKGSDFTRNWSELRDYISDHWIYLELPEPMQRGAEYSIRTGILAENGKTFSLVYDEFQSRSETVHVNQIGFVPTARRKYAYLSQWMGSIGRLSLDDFKDAPFHVYDIINEKIVYTGKIALRKDYETGGPDSGQQETPNQNYTGADVWECDFSSFKEPGEYKIVVEGIGGSFPFKINKDVFREAFITTCRGLYHHRCGIALEEPYTKWTKGRCHHPDDQDSVIISDWRFMDGGNAFSELPLYKTKEKRYYWGGWHDAGDWDRHHKHMNASSFLLMVYEFAPGRFSDGELNIPESGNGIPDIIDEAKWGVDLFKRMQEPGGGVHGGIETHRHPGEGISSVTDTDQWYAYQVEPQASYHYAAVAGRLAFCLQLAGKPELAEEYISSAIKAYDWAGSNMREGDETKVKDVRIYAAASLFKLTGEDKYQQQYKADNMILTSATDLTVWGEYDQQFAVWTYITTEQPNIDSSLKKRLTAAAENYARSNNIDTAELRSGRMGYDWWQPARWGGATTPKNLPLIAAYHVSKDKEFLDQQYLNCDYYLGGNPLNMCWVTGLGDRPPKEVMHLDSWFYFEDKGMAPGIVPYGPYNFEPFTEKDYNGPWDIEFGLSTTYPDASVWPCHELWFENRYCPPTNEYTVWQTISRAAAAFGYLCADVSGGYGSKGAAGSGKNFKIYYNFPNPFAQNTTIYFELLKSADVKITVYDVLGREVRRLVNRQMDDGRHEISWDGTDKTGTVVSSGIYFYRIKAAGEHKSVKMLLLRS